VATVLELEAPPARARAWLFALAVGLPGLGLLVAFAWHGGPRLWWPGTGIHLVDQAIAIAVPLLVLLAVWSALALAFKRHRIEAADGVVTVVAGWHRARLNVAELRLDQARVGALDEHPEWKPWLKSNGMAVPGFRAGWFRTRDFQRVFACITDGERVLWLPTARKHALLLQAARPQELLARLRALAPPAAHG
jgi:hypothetical protein